MQADPNKVKAIFLAAIENCTPKEWDAYLDQVCAGDAELRRRVEVLLRAHVGQDTLFDASKPESLPTVKQPVSEGPGAIIGPYKLLQKIGEGGMGVVYMADQTEPVKRRVALKIIKPGMDSRQVIARFEAERQALAMMDHPNIAKVLDAETTESGRPYFVMELVKGIPITKFSDENHLTPRERLELFTPVCQAVQHAHQKGIIHRDLKPSNVLVALYDGRPVPKVIDFGVAKATSQKLTERTVFTHYGQIVGTLEYMSPEQAVLNQLDIDTRSDIYSLGVLLYELLTGTTPFDRQRLRSAAMDEMMRIIREEEPPKPSTRLSSDDTLPTVAANRKTEPRKLSVMIRGELDWIVMKALEKDRARRYETANAFAADVQRYLNDEAVEACPPSAGYKFRKFARRNKAALSAAAAIAVALVVGTVVSTWQAVRATRAEALAASRFEQEQAARREADAAHQSEARQRVVAESERDRAREAEELAEANFGKARAAVNEYFTTISETQLLSVPGLQPLREELLVAALRFYEEFAKERSDEPELQIDLADTHYKLNRIYAELRRGKEASEALERAESMYEELLNAGHDSARVKLGLAKVHYIQASSVYGPLSTNVRTTQRDPTAHERALADLKRALAEQGSLRASYEKTVALCKEILNVDPDHVEARRTLGDTYNLLGNATKEAGNLPDSLTLHRQALELRETLARDDPDNADSLAQLAGSVNNIGTILQAQGQYREALAMYRRAREYILQVRDMVPHVILYGRWLAIGHSNVGNMENKLGNQEAALEALKALVATRRRLVVENPAVPGLKKDLFSDFRRLANYQRSLGRETEAQRSFRSAREILENLPTDTPNDLMLMATVYASLAGLASEEADNPNQELAEQRRDYSDRAIGAVRKAVEGGYNNLAMLKGNADLAVIRDREEYQSLVEQVEKSVEAAKLAQSTKGTEEEKLRDRKKAQGLLEQLAEDQPDQLRHQITLATTAQSIGLIEAGLKNLDEAEKAFEQALEIRKKISEKEPDSGQYKAELGGAHVALGNFYWNSDRIAQGLQHWNKAFDLLDAAVALAPEDATVLQTAAEHRRTVFERYGEIGLWDRAIGHFDQSLKGEHTFDALWDIRFAHVLAAQGRLEEHRDLCRLLAEKWGNSRPADVLLAMSLNPSPVLEPDQLLKLADAAIQAEPNSVENFWASSAYYRAGQYQRALELMLEARPRDFIGPGYRYWYAMVYHKLGQGDLADHMFEQAEAAYEYFALNCLNSPPLTAVHTGHGGYWWAWAEDQAMRKQAWEVVRGKPAPDDPWQHLIQARAYRLVGDEDRQKAELSSAVASTPDDPGIWSARARLYESWGETALAEADWQRVVEVAAADPAAWVQRGRHYAEQGKHEQADADFAKAAELAGEKLNPFLEAGWWVAGPYPGNTDVVQSPETYPDPSQELSLPPDQKRTRWQHVPTEAFGKVDFGKPFGELKNASAYALAFIYSEDERDATLKLGSDDGGRLWFNGELLQSSVSPVFSAFGLHSVRLRLRAGRNTLLVKVHNAFGPHFLHARFVEEPLDQALTFAEAGLWKEAATLFHFIRSTLPVDGHVWRVYGNSLIASGAGSDRYREFYEAAAANVASNSYVAFDAAWACGLAREPLVPVEKLVQLAEAQFEADPKNVDRTNCLALAYYRAGRFQDALEQLEKNSAAANDARSAALQAMIHHALGDKASARAWLQKSLAHFNNLNAFLRTPSHLPRHGHIAWPEILILHGEAAKGITGQEIVDANTRRMWRAQTFVHLGQMEKAEAEFQQAVEAEPDDPANWIARGRFYAQRGDHEKADADFTKAATLAPNELDQFLQGGWWVVGPYPNKIDEFCPPEIDPDPSKPVYTVDPATGLSDEPAPWQSLATFPDGSVSTHRLIPNDRKTAIYAMAYVYSPDERSVLVRAAAGEGIRIWVNGALVHHRSEGIAGTIWADRVPVVLRAGRNTLLVKSPTRYFIVRLCDNLRDRVLGLAEQRRFVTAAELLEGDAIDYLPDADSTLWASLLLPLASSGHLKEFENQFHRLIDRHGGTTDLNQAIWITRVCPQVPNAVFVAHADRLVQIAEDFLVRRPEQWAMLNAAIVNYRAGRFDRAGEHLEAIKSDGWATHALPLGAMLAHQKGDAEEAKRKLTEAKAKFEAVCRAQIESTDPSRPAEFWWWYDWLQFQTLLIEAEQLIEGGTTIAQRAKELEAHYDAYWTNRDPQTVAFDHAILMRPEDNNEHRADPYVARGRQLAQLGRFDEAEADFNQAVAVAPDQYEPLVERAEFYVSRGRIAEATDDLAAALPLANRKHGYSQGGSWVEAAMKSHLPVIDELQKRSPGNSAWWRLRAEHAAMRHDWSEVARCFSASDSWWGHLVGLAAVHSMQGNQPGYDFARVKLAQVVESQVEPAADRSYWRGIVLGLHKHEPVLAEELQRLAATLRESDPDSRRYRFLTGLAHYRAGQYDQAVEPLHASFWGNLGGDAPQWAVLAMTYSRLGRPDEAQHWLKRCVVWRELDQRRAKFDARRYRAAGSPSWLVAHAFIREAELLVAAGEPIVRAREHLQANEHDKAIAVLTEALDHLPEHVDLWELRGEIYGTQQRWEEAGADFAKAIELGHPWKNLWHRRAITFLAAGDVQGYRQHCRDLIARLGESDDPGTLSHIAWNCSIWPGATEDPQQPVAIAERAVAATRHVYHLYNNAGVLYRAGRYEEALEKLGESIEARGRGGVAHEWLFLAMTHQRLGNTDEARRWLNQAQNWLDTNEITWIKPEWRWSNRLELELLLREAELLVAGQEPTAEALAPAIAARLHLRAQRFDEAIAVLSAGLEKLPQCPELWKLRGMAHEAQQRWNEAASDFAQAMSLGPPDTDLWQRRGESLLAAGDDQAYRQHREDVIGRYAELIRLQPEFLQHRLERARMLLAAGRHQEALSDYEEVLSVAPVNLDALRGKCIALLAGGNETELRNTCQALIARYGETEDVALATCIVDCCKQSPNALDDWTPVLGLAERAVEIRDKPKWMVNWMLRNHAAILYRAGRYDEAAKRLEGLMDGNVGTAMWLALAYQQLGKGKEAERLAAEAQSWLERNPHDRLFVEFELRHRELMSLIQSSQNQE